MRRVPLIAAFIVCLLAAGPEAEARKAKPSVDQVRTLVSASSRAWDRRAIGGEPLAIRATVAIRLPGRKPLDGTWSFEFVGAGLFREELEVAGFREVLVANERGWWLDRKPKRYLQLVADIQDALDPARHLDVGETRRITAVKSGKHAGRPVLMPRIVEQAGTPPAAFDLRLDAATGAPVRFDCRFSHTSYEYEGEIEIGDSRFPKQVRVLHSNRVVVTIDLEQVAPRERALALTPPPGAEPAIPESAPNCEKFRSPVATLSPKLRYPGGAAFARAAGQVRGRLVIDPGGEILRHHVTWASDAVFADSALEAIDGRRYRPGRCAGEPVPVLSTFTFSFGSGR